MPTIPSATQTQLHKILEALQDGRRLTVAVALSDLGVYALSQRIGELKRLGWPIERTMVRVPGGATVAQYYLSGVQPREERIAFAYASLT